MSCLENVVDIHDYADALKKAYGYLQQMVHSLFCIMIKIKDFTNFYTTIYVFRTFRSIFVIRTY